MTKKGSMIYGVNPVKESLLADTPINKIYLLQNRRDKVGDEVRALAKRRNVPILMAKREQLDQMAQTQKHQGMVAFIATVTHCDIDDLIAQAKKKTAKPFFLLLDGLEDPRNLGAIIRTVDAAGGNGVVIPDRRAVGLTATVSKSSAGALSHLPVAQVRNLSPAIDRLKSEGFWIVGLDVKGKKSYTQYDFTGPVAIVVGGEGKGIRPKLLEKCDETVSLPMLGHVQSLNVAVAVGVVVYELLRQRSLR